MFVIGNGPSVDPARLNLLLNERTVGLGACGVIFDRTGWRPWHYVATSSFVGREEYRVGMMAAFESARDVWATRQYEKFTEREDVNWVEARHSSERTYSPPAKWWSEDPREWVSKYGTSAFAALQIMAWYGYDEIYLYGMDGYKAGENHYQGYPVSEGFNYAHYNRTRVAAFDLAHRMLGIVGVDLYVIGETDLDFLPAVAWEDVDRLG